MNKSKINTKVGNVSGVNIQNSPDTIVNVNSIEENKPEPISLMKVPPQAGISKLIGRKDDIESIKELLKKDTSIVFIDAMGGVGKSELCRTICNDEDNEVVGWFDYSESLNKTLLKIADDKMIGTPEKDAIELKRVKSYLCSLGKEYLMVFDNVEELSQDEVEFVRCLKCCALITTRKEYKGLGKIVKPYSLDLLSKEDCIELFDYYSNKEHTKADEADLKKIIKLTGKHTLALELLAKIYGTSMTIKTINQLLSELETTNFDLHNFITANADTESKEFIEHMTKLFDIAGIKDDEGKMHILKNLCILPSLPIPDIKILEWLGEEKENDLLSLASSGWLKKENDSIVMHSVIGATLKIKLIPSYDECAELMNAILNEIPTDVANPERYHPQYLPQCAGIADFFLEREVYDENFSFFYHELAGVYKDKGEYAKALESYEKALAIKLKVHGAEHPSTGTK